MSGTGDQTPGAPDRPAASGPILVLGTAALDRLVRLSGPLVPGGKIEGEEREARLGGGGANAAVALARAGREVRIAATIGTDPAGELLLAELRRAGVDTALVQRAPDATPQALVLVDPAGERTVVRARVPGPTTARDAPLPEPGSIACLFLRGDAAGLAPFVAHLPPSCLVVAHIPPCTPGSRPAHVLIGSKGDLGAAFLDDPLGAGREAAGDLLQWVVVTAGAAGAEAFGVDGTRLAVAAAPARVVDSTGAGDAFAAGLIHGLLGGRSMERALRIAAAWGAAAVEREGGAPTAGFPPPDAP